MRSLITITAGLSTVLLSACMTTPEPLVPGPLSATPVAKPAQVERAVTGSLFQPDSPVTSLFSGTRPPRLVGDTLKIDIAETLSASSKLSTEANRANTIATKGPGAGAKLPPGLLRSLGEIDASASGSDTFKGTGNASQSQHFNGKIAVTVINVLPNGNLLVAGERAVSFNKGLTTVRFSGLVNPSDIGVGNVVASSDVVNARLEAVGDGEAADATQRSWLQRVFTKALSVW